MDAERKEFNIKAPKSVRYPGKKDENHVKLKIFIGIVISLIIGLLMIVFVRNTFPEVATNARDWIAQILYSDEDIDPYFGKGIDYKDIENTKYDPIKKPIEYWHNQSNASIPGPLDLKSLAVVWYDNGNEVLKIIVPIGEKLNESDLIVGKKPGYIFDGWIQGGKDFDFSKPITKNTVLGSRWKATDVKNNTYTVSFKVGSNIIEVQEVEKGGYAKMVVPPELEGTAFVGWRLNGVPFTWETPITKNIVLVAYYKQTADINPKKTYTVNYTLDGESYPCFISTIFEGQRAATPSQQYCSTVRANHVFTGWYNGNDKFSFLTPIYNNYNLVGNFKASSSGGTVIEKPVQKVYNVYVNNGRTLKILKVKEGETISASQLQFAYAGNSNYRFLGWYESDTDNVYDFSTRIYKNTYIEAKSEYIGPGISPTIPKEVKVTVKFYVDGKYIRTANVEKGKTMEAYTYAIEGYTFDGWYINDTNEKFNFNNPINENMELKGTTVINKVYVDFYVNDVKVKSDTLNYGEKASSFEPTYDEEFQKFLGWYNGPTKYNFSNKVTENISLNARFEDLSYKYNIYWNPKFAGDLLNINGDIYFPYEGNKSKGKITGAINLTERVINVLDVYTYTYVGTVPAILDDNLNVIGTSVSQVTDVASYKENNKKLYYGAIIQTDDGRIIDTVKGNLITTSIINTATEMSNDKLYFNKANTVAKDDKYETSFSIKNNDNQYKEFNVIVYENGIEVAKKKVALEPGQSVNDVIKTIDIDKNTHDFKIKYELIDLGYTVKFNEDYHQINIGGVVCTECTRDRINLDYMWSKPINNGNQVEIHLALINNLDEVITLENIYDLNKPTNKVSLNDTKLGKDNKKELVFVIDNSVNNQFAVQFAMSSQKYDTHTGPLYVADLRKVEAALPDEISVKNYVWTAPDENGKQTLIVYFKNNSDLRTKVEVSPYPANSGIFGTQVLVTDPHQDFSISFYGYTESDIKKIVPDGVSTELIGDVGILTYNPNSDYVSKFITSDLKAEVDYDSQKLNISGKIDSNLDETLYHKLTINCTDELGDNYSYNINEQVYKTNGDSYEFEKSVTYSQHSAVCKLDITWDDQVSDVIENTNNNSSNPVKKYLYKAPVFTNIGNHRVSNSDIKIDGGITKITVPQYDTGKQEIEFKITDKTDAYKFIIVDAVYVDGQNILDKTVTLSKNQNLPISTDILTSDNHDVEVKYHTSIEYKLTQVGDWWPGVVTNAKLVQCTESDMGLCYDITFKNTAKFNTYEFSQIGYWAIPKNPTEQNTIMNNFVNHSSYLGIPQYKTLGDDITLAKQATKNYRIPLSKDYYVYNFDNEPNKVEEIITKDNISGMFNMYLEGSHSIVKNLSIVGTTIYTTKNNSTDGETGSVYMSFDIVNEFNSDIIIDGFSLRSGRKYVDISKNTAGTGTATNIDKNDYIVIPANGSANVLVQLKRGQKDYKTEHDQSGTGPTVFDTFDVLGNITAIKNSTGKISLHANNVYIKDKNLLNDIENGTYKVGSTTYYKMNSEFDTKTIVSGDFTAKMKALSYGGNTYLYGVEGAYSTANSTGSKLGWYTLKYNGTTKIDDEVSTYRPAEILLGTTRVVKNDASIGDYTEKGEVDISASTITISGISRVQ